MLNNIKFSYEVAENQSDLFTRHHMRYKCVIRYEGKRYTFEYQCNPHHITPNKRDCLECLISDADSAEYALDVDDFLRAFGYDDSLENIRKGEKAFKACKRTKKALERVFGDSLDTLREEIENV